MIFKAVLKSLFLIAIVSICIFRQPPVAGAQDDPNAQYILVQSGELSQGDLEIEVPVEVGVLRLQFNLQYEGDVRWTVLSPSNRPLQSDAANIAVTDTDGKRSILMWDPRPGNWKIRLTGSGRFTTSVTAQGELYVCCIQFFGRSGVQVMDRFQPPRGSRQQSQIYASGYNIEVIEFRMIDERGNLIGPIKFRQSDYSTPHNFTLLIDTPERPFRVLARGRDNSGKQFQRVIGWLIKPQPAETIAAQNEGGGNQQPARQVQQWALPQDWNREVVEGEYRIVRSQIVKWTDEMLLSEKGNPIGIRLKYTIRFPLDGSYSPYPSIYPERVGYGFTGALGLRVHRGTVEPSPDGLQNNAQWMVGGRGNFKAGTDYNFTIDLIPNYAVFNEQKKSFCLQTKSYSQPGLRERFEREVMSETRIRYRLSVSGTDLDGRQPSLTETAYVPGVWYQGYLMEGARDCQ